MKGKFILLSLLVIFLLSSCMSTKLERVGPKVEEISKEVEVTPAAVAPLAMPEEKNEEESDAEEELSTLYSGGEFIDFKNGEEPMAAQESLPPQSETVEVKTEEDDKENREEFAPVPKGGEKGNEGEDVNTTLVHMILVLFLLIAVFGLISLVSRGKERGKGLRKEEKDGEGDNF